MLIDTLDKTLKVNDKFKATFTLPLSKIPIEVMAVVYKTYDEFRGQHGLPQAGTHRSELTFHNISPEAKKRIGAFQVLVGAVKKPGPSGAGNSDPKSP